MAELDDIALIGSSITLSNGTKVANRLIKAAMEEGISHPGGTPGPRHRKLYSTWAEGGWGIIITGNVQVDRRHLATPHDRFIADDSPSTVAAYRLLHQSMRGKSGNDEPLTIVQLSHPGLQSSALISFARAPWSSAVAPIEARPDLGTSFVGQVLGRLIWPFKSRKIQESEMHDVVQKFIRAAKVVEEAGFSGVQVHSAHGYLLAEFLSPQTNPNPISMRDVPSSIPIRLHMLYSVLGGINKNTSAKFVLAVKINCSDFAQGGLTEEQAAEMVKNIVSWGFVDILEISGGTYASPAFASPESIARTDSHVTRQSLFAHFTTSLLPHLPPPPSGPAILLTGGLHDRELIASSIRNRSCDLVGIGRPACLRPRLPNEVMLNRAVTSEDTHLGGYEIPGAELIKTVFGGSKKVPDSKQSSANIPLVGAGVSTFWHEMQLNRIGRGKEPDPKCHWIRGIFVELIWYGIIAKGPIGWFLSLYR